jgi:hypothetical protein
MASVVNGGSRKKVFFTFFGLPNLDFWFVLVEKISNLPTLNQYMKLSLKQGFVGLELVVSQKDLAMCQDCVVISPG